jgi:Kef-type K+ transport system membrane component KefB
VLGLAMPRGRTNHALRRMMLPLASTVLLPMFFVTSGLNTRLTLLDTWTLWGLAGLVTLCACGGKLLACALAARLAGEPPRQAWAIGAMMNARGLMELIILNIGLERGVITPTLFAVGVIMAIVTTLMATPLFDLILGRHAHAQTGTPPEPTRCPQPD